MTDIKLETLQEISESLSFKVSDADKIDGINVLARVSGPAFFPDTVSDNNVRYTREFWNDILNDSDVKRVLDDKTMFGTIGHKVVHITDEELLKGITSHITVRMWIDESTGVGMAEHLVLNTEAGRILNTILRAGSKLRVSTRGLGNLSVGNDGVNEIDEFFFQRIDFVINPGYIDALPSVVESLNKLENGNTNITNTEEQPMADTTDKVADILQGQIEDLKAQAEKAEDRINAKDEELDAQKEALAEVKDQLKDSERTLDAYDELGTPEEISEALRRADQIINQYSVLGSPKEISESMDQATLVLTSMGTKMKTNITESTSRKIAQLSRKVEAYNELGTPEEISEAFNSVDKLIKSNKRLIAESLSKRFKTSRSIIEALLETNDQEEVEAMLEEQYEAVEEDDEDMNDPNVELALDDIDYDEDEDEDEYEVSESRRSRRKVSNIRGNRRTGMKTLSESLGNTGSLASRLLKSQRTI